MRYNKQFSATAIIIITMPLASVCARASDLDSDSAALTALQAKADQAPTRDRCFIYAELVGQLADRFDQQIKLNDSEQASESLRLLRQYADRMDSAIADDSKKLKDAELITRHATFRLGSMLRGASYEDRPALDATLKLLYRTQTNLMMRVFKR
jgi:hypothetical protein